MKKQLIRDQKQIIKIGKGLLHEYWDDRLKRSYTTGVLNHATKLFISFDYPKIDKSLSGIYEYVLVITKKKLVRSRRYQDVHVFLKYDAMIPLYNIIFKKRQQESSSIYYLFYTKKKDIPSNLTRRRRRYGRQRSIS